MNKNFKRNTGFVIAGLAAGFAVGVLLAPKSGKETRSDVRRGGNAVFDCGAAFWQKVGGRGERPAEFALYDEGVVAGRR